METAQSVRTRPFISRLPRSESAIRDLLEPNGELLPLDFEGGEYYFYNITTYVNALDREHSECDWRTPPTPPNVAYEIIYYAFHEQSLDGLSIFRLFESAVDTLVTDQFVQRVHAAGLNGFHFTKIWPFPLGVKWWDEAVRLRKQKYAVSTKIKGHTLVVALPLEGKKRTPAEKKKITKLEKELDAQLMVSSSKCS